MNYNQLVGSTLGQYKLTEHIGQGGMSAVYRAHQPSVNRYVAVKVLHESLATDPVIFERFQREARATAHLEHPHVIPLYDYGQQDGMIFLVMRYLGGGTLADRLSGNQLPSLQETARLLDQVAPALEAAHQAGIIHRDIKPSNIMFDERGNAYLGDFGIAGLTHAANDITGETIVGTPAYMSPEQVTGEQITPAADIYALGTVIYHMVTGRTPFSADNVSSLIYNLVAKPPTPATAHRPDLPRSVSDVLAKALAKQPEDRYQSAGELARAFEAAVSGVQESDTGLFHRPPPVTAPSAISDTSPTISGIPLYPAAPVQSSRSKAAPAIRWVVLAALGIIVLLLGLITFLGNQAAGGSGPDVYLLAVGAVLLVVGLIAVNPLQRLRSAARKPPVLSSPSVPASASTTTSTSEFEPVTQPVAPPPVSSAPPLRLDMLVEGGKLRHYELRKRLDKGEKNRVFQAYDTHMERDVAIKVLNLGFKSGDASRLRFEQEARILRTLHNPHIIPFFDYADEGDLIYIVMPLLEGGTLKDRLDGQPQPYPQVMRLVREIASALDYLHSKNVIHRDLKSSNIMFDSQGNAFLVDFGIAKTQDAGMNLTSAGEVIGTPFYIPPEQWIGLPVTPASDLYSLGVLVFQMLTGRLPFDGENTFAMLQQHVYEQPPAPSAFQPSLPSAVDEVLLRALAKKPENRHPSARQFAEELEQAFLASKVSAEGSGHIFISYSRSDRDYARKLAEQIRQHGFKAWIDDNIDYGDRWFKEIESAIDTSGAVVVVMTPAARESEWVHKEILIAKSCKKAILPLLLEGKEFGILIDIQYVDVTSGQMPGGDFYQRLNYMVGH